MASVNTGPGLPPKPLPKSLKKPCVPPPVRSVPPNTAGVNTEEADHPPLIPPKPQPSPTRTSSGKKPLPQPKFRNFDCTVEAFTDSLQPDMSNPENISQETSSSDSQIWSASPVPVKRGQSLPGNSATLPLSFVPVVPPKPHVPLLKSQSQEALYEDIDASEETRLHRSQSLWSKPHSSRANKSISIGSTKPVYLSESMTLSQLVKKYSKSFPIRIAITTGYFGPTPRLTLSAGDAFNIHFQKCTKVVVIRDAQASPYSVPLNSVLQFGLIQRGVVAKGQTSLSQENLIFERVGDVLALPTLPRVIAATVPWGGEAKKGSVEGGEILIVKQSPKLKILNRGRKSLKVFSVLTRSEKTLPEDCCGHFTISPNRLLLHLPDLMEHVPNLFPSESIIYCNPQNERKLKDLPPGFLSRSVTLCKCIKETSLVASSARVNERIKEPGGNPEREDLIDIPVDDEALQIEVTVIDSSDSQDTEKLYEDTRFIYERFDPSALKSFKDTGSEETYVTQSLFYEAIRPGCEKVGVELEEPSAIYERIPAYIRPANAAPVGIAKEVNTESAATKIPPGSPIVKHDSIHGRFGSCPDTWIVDSGSQPGSVKAVHRNSTEKLNSLEAEVKQTREEIEKVKAMVLQMTKQSSSLETRIQALSKSSTTASVPSSRGAGSNSADSSRTSTPSGSPSATADETNREYLSSLDMLQIQNLLDAMGLSQYKESFLREQITGDVLLDLDDAILQEELGVTSKIHRIRLTKLIRGRHSAQSVLNGVDPYASFGSH